MAIYHILARSEYGLKVQVFAGLIAYLLLAIYCHRQHGEKVGIKTRSRTSISNYRRIENHQAKCNENTQNEKKTKASCKTLTGHYWEIWEYAWQYKDHGKNFIKNSLSQLKSEFRWLHDSFGTNLRLTEMQSAIGRVALKKVDTWVKKRRENASLLHDIFAQSPTVTTPVPPSDVYHAYYKFYTFVETENLKKSWDRNRIMSTLNEKGVPCYYGSCSEIYLEKAFLRANLAPNERLPIAKKLGEISLMFLVDPTIKRETINSWSSTIEEILEKAEKKSI